MSKINVGRIRDILHESIITVEQIALYRHSGKLGLIKVIRQPNKQFDRTNFSIILKQTCQPGCNDLKLIK